MIHEDGQRGGLLHSVVFGSNVFGSCFFFPALVVGESMSKAEARGCWRLRPGRRQSITCLCYACHWVVSDWVGAQIMDPIEFNNKKNG